MSVAGIIFLAKLHAYRAAVARGETEQAAVRFAAEAEYAEDKRMEDRLALYPELVKALESAAPAIQWGQTHQPGNTVQWAECVKLIRAVLAQADAIEKGE